MSQGQKTPSKSQDIPETALSDAERIDLIANLVLDIITGEQAQPAGEEPCQTS